MPPSSTRPGTLRLAARAVLLVLLTAGVACESAGTGDADAAGGGGACFFEPGNATYDAGAHWSWDCNSCTCADGTWQCTTMGCPSDGGATPADADAASDAPPPTEDVPAALDVAAPATCGAENATSLRLCVEEARYAADLRFVAAPREPGSDHWQEAQDLCAARLEELGFAVERFDYATGVDVVGVIEGEVAPSEVVVISAHYDHIPGCPGADDNASGIAGALESARVLAQGRYERTLIVACWDEEELGLLGAFAWSGGIADRGQTIVTSLVYEMIGYRDPTPGAQSLPPGINLLFPEQTAWLEERGSRGDFLAIIADERSHASSVALEAHAAAIGLPAIVLEVQDALTTSPALATLQRSDHAAFWWRGYAGTMLTDTSEFRNPHYHCRDSDDTVDTLDDAFAADIVRATVGAAAELLGVR